MIPTRTSRGSLAFAALAAVASFAHADDTARPDRPDRIARVEHHDPSAAPARGPIDAPVTVEIYFVPSVGLASTRLNAFKLLEALQAKHPSRVRLIWRVMPQNMYSTAALEAQAQGKFGEFLDRIQQERANLTKEKIFEIAKSIGMDADRVAAALSQDRYRQTLSDNERRSRRLHVSGQPVAVFNSVPARFSMSASNLKAEDLDRAYTDAWDRAVELMDQGVPASQLSAAFDAKVLANTPTQVIAPADDDNESHDQMLVSPPLNLTGMPTVGDDTTSVPIIFLCAPGQPTCQKLMDKMITLQKDVYPDLRLIWAPFFDVGREDAGEWEMLANAALCAEQLGSGSPPKSAGWLWVETLYRQLGQNRRGRTTIDQRVDSVGKELDIDSQRMSSCRARMVDTTFKWIEQARKSGVRTSPSVIVGGRIYAALQDPSILQSLIEAELAPGISDALHEHLGRWPR